MAKRRIARPTTPVTRRTVAQRTTRAARAETKDVGSYIPPPGLLTVDPALVQPEDAWQLGENVLRHLVSAQEDLRRLAAMASAAAAEAFPDRFPPANPRARGIPRDFLPATPERCDEARSVLAFVSDCLRRGERWEWDGLRELALRADRQRDPDKEDGGELRERGARHLPKSTDIARELASGARWRLEDLTDADSLEVRSRRIKYAATYIICGLLQHSRAFELPANGDPERALKAVVRRAGFLDVLDDGKLAASLPVKLLLECLIGLGLPRIAARGKLKGLEQEQRRPLKRKGWRREQK